MATASVVFDTTNPGPSDEIKFHVTTDAPMTQTVTVTGQVEAADGTELPATSQTTVYGMFGPFTADQGYTVAPDPDFPDDLSRFVATPPASGP